MWRDSRIRLVVCGVLLHVAITAQTQAESITVEFYGVIDLVQDPAGKLDPRITIGGPAVARATYDPGNDNDFNGHPDAGEYHFDDPLTIGFGDVLFEGDGLGIGVDNHPIAPADALDFGDGFFSSQGFDELLLFVRFEDSSKTALSSDSIPATFSLAEYPDMRRFYLQENIQPGMRIEGEITSITIIPEPSAGLCLFGLAAPLVRRRSRGNM